MSKEKKAENNKGKTSFLFKLGITLMILSTLKYVALLYVPFSPYSSNVKIGLITVFLVFAEIIFWGGAFLVGEEVYKKYKKYLSPANWIKKAEKAKLVEGKKELSKEAIAPVSAKEKERD
ncbi:MAG: transporter suffix domain-containing protein [Candidatus Firestonebacteria bacterium]